MNKIIGDEHNEPKWKSIAQHDVFRIHGFFGEYRWMSNFHICPVFFEGLLYQNSEAAYQAAKLPSSDRLKFTTVEPAESKRLAWKIKIDKSKWDLKKYDVMSVILFDKFYRNLDLREKLINTTGRHLEETNWWKDTYWGVCEGKGENKLGEILMKIRSYWL